MDGGVSLGSATLSGGVATFTTSTLSAGSHYITVAYDGDANFDDSGSLAHIHTVNEVAKVNLAFVGGIIAAGGAACLILILLIFRRRKRKQQA